MKIDTYTKLLHCALSLFVLTATVHGVEETKGEGEIDEHKTSLVSLPTAAINDSEETLQSKSTDAVKSHTHQITCCNIITDSELKNLKRTILSHFLCITEEMPVGTEVLEPDAILYHLSYMQQRHAVTSVFHVEALTDIIASYLKLEERIPLNNYLNTFKIKHNILFFASDHTVDDEDIINKYVKKTNFVKDNFLRCRGDLTSVTLPNNVQSIGNGFLYGCRYLKSITLSDNLESIGNGFLEDCTSLKNITIPNSVNSSGKRFLRNCTSLESIKVVPGSAAEKIIRTRFPKLVGKLVY